MPRTPTTELIVTIDPARRFSIGRATARHAKNAPPRFVSMTARQSSSESFMIRLSRVIPALQTRMAIGPTSDSTWLTSAVAPSGVEMSPATAVALPPAARIPAHTASAASAELA